jgi:formylglycine-generating enzyme required for sulfatase activity
MPRKPAEVFVHTGAIAIAAFSLVTGPVQAAGAAPAGEDDLTLDLGGKALVLRRIPKGKFVQGSAATDAIHEADETQRSVTLTRTFWMGAVPVTRAQFSKFVSETRFMTDAEKGTNGGFGWDGHAVVQKKEFTWRSPGFPQRDEDPVVIVSFADANAFAAWASRKTARRVRLPTEAEWEYAARGGTTTPWYGATKEEEALALGWYKQNALWTTHPGGQKKPNPFGLFDMGGNVFQWCRDVYAPYPAGDATDPENTTPATGDAEKRVLRGGSWLREPKRGRSAARHKGAPGMRNADYGFRVVVEEDGAVAPAGSAAAADPAPAPAASPSATASAAAADPAPSSVPAPLPTTARAPEGSPWTLVLAPIASAIASVGWVLARRRRRELDVIEAEWSAATSSLPVRSSMPSIPRQPSVILPPREPSVIPPPPSVPSVRLPSVPLALAAPPASPSVPPPPSASPAPTSVSLRAAKSVPPPLPPSARMRAVSPSPPVVSPSPPAPFVGPPTPAEPIIPVDLASEPAIVAEELGSEALIPAPESSLAVMGPPSPPNPFTPKAPLPPSPAVLVPPPPSSASLRAASSAKPLLAPPPLSSSSLLEPPAPSSPFAPSPSAAPPPSSPFAPSPSAAPPSPFARSPSAPPPPLSSSGVVPPSSPQPKELKEEMSDAEDEMRKSIAEGLIALSTESEAEEKANEKKLDEELRRPRAPALGSSQSEATNEELRRPRAPALGSSQSEATNEEEKP